MHGAKIGLSSRWGGGDNPIVHHAPDCPSAINRPTESPCPSLVVQMMVCAALYAYLSPASWRNPAGGVNLHAAVWKQTQLDDSRDTVRLFTIPMNGCVKARISLPKVRRLYAAGYFLLHFRSYALWTTENRTCSHSFYSPIRTPRWRRRTTSVSANATIPKPTKFTNSMT